jgi:hypothetical protein
VVQRDETAPPPLAVGRRATPAHPHLRDAQVDNRRTAHSVAPRHSRPARRVRDHSAPDCPQCSPHRRRVRDPLAPLHTPATRATAGTRTGRGGGAHPQAASDSRGPRASCPVRRRG